MMSHVQLWVYSNLTMWKYNLGVLIVTQYFDAAAALIKMQKVMF